MPLIKPRTRGKQFIRLISRLDRENNETLHAYAQFIGESAEYVNFEPARILANDKSVSGVQQPGLLRFRRSSHVT